MIQVRIIALSIFLGLAVSVPGQAQPSNASEKAQVLILGTYHFANPGRDIVKTKIADVLSPSKQSEINRVVEALGRFRPTRIAVEAETESSPVLDSLYEAYRSGLHELTRNETQQLGFRLAARFNLPRLYPVNFFNDFPFEAMMEYAQVHDTAFVSFIEEALERYAEESNRRQQQHTIGEILRLVNDPDNLAADHGVYMRFSRVGAGDTFVGADLVAKWYERNIMIFANLQRITEPGDRVLVIYGSGHAPTLRELVAYDPEMDLVDPLEYLPRE